MTWREPAVGKSWQGGKGFAFDSDAGPAGPAVVVQPENGSDTVDPPIEYQLDVTDLVHIVAGRWGAQPRAGDRAGDRPERGRGVHVALPDIRLRVQPGAVYTEADGAGAALRVGVMPELLITAEPLTGPRCFFRVRLPVARDQ